MIRTKEVIPPTLEHSLLATRVLAALYAGGRSNSPLLEGTFDDAARFLRSIVMGRRNMQQRTVSANSVEYAFAYGEAIRAIELLPRPPKLSAELDNFIRALLETAESLSLGKEVSSASVEQLREFFRRVGEVAISRDQQPIETVSLSR